jgi:hypothetical protein
MGVAHSVRALSGQVQTLVPPSKKKKEIEQNVQVVGNVKIKLKLN